MNKLKDSINKSNQYVGPFKEALHKNNITIESEDSVKRATEICHLIQQYENATGEHKEMASKKLSDYVTTCGELKFPEGGDHLEQILSIYREAVVGTKKITQRENILIILVITVLCFIKLG